MVSEIRTSQGEYNNRLALDPKLDKEAYKQKITRTILDQVKGSSVEEVYRLVDEGYERLLKHASITMHIPVLVEGLVRAEERKRFREH
jgi:hypothetical protein